jgi:hypothetical protein
LLLTTVIGTSSVPKNCCIVCTIALLTHEWPEAWSGNPGLISGGPDTATVGSNRGTQPGSAVVARFPSVAASRIAVLIWASAGPSSAGGRAAPPGSGIGELSAAGGLRGRSAMPQWPRAHKPVAERRPGAPGTIGP